MSKDKDKDEPKKIKPVKIKPARVFTFSLPDDVADELDKLKERGMKSKIATEAFRQYFKTKPEPAVEETIMGLTEEEILKRVWNFLGDEIERKNKEYEDKIKKARKEEDYGRATTYRKIYQKHFWEGYGSQHEEHPYRQQITIAEVQTIFGLPYHVIYNKILPILRKAGYRIVKERIY